MLKPIGATICSLVATDKFLPMKCTPVTRIRKGSTEDSITSIILRPYKCAEGFIIIPFQMFSLPIFHLFSARTHANVDKRTLLLTEESNWLIPHDPSSCWFCSIHSTHWGKHGVWSEPRNGTIETHAVSYGDGGNSTCRSRFLILLSSSFICCS
jgi:hypothetical protein